MQLMFESLEDAIVLVDKDKIGFQNSEYESMIDHLRQLTTQIDQA
jgi:hypothetical protein